MGFSSDQGPGSAVDHETLPAGHLLVPALGAPLDGIPGALATKGDGSMSHEFSIDSIDVMVIYDMSIIYFYRFYRFERLRLSSQTHVQSRFASISNIFPCEEQVTNDADFPRLFFRLRIPQIGL